MLAGSWCSAADHARAVEQPDHRLTSAGVPEDVAPLRRRRSFGWFCLRERCDRRSKVRDAGYGSNGSMCTPVILVIGIAALHARWGAALLTTHLCYDAPEKTTSGRALLQHC
jgi:hypothetical protein